MKRKQIRLVDYCLVIGLIIVLTLAMPACSSKSSTTETTPTPRPTTTSIPTPTPTPAPTPTPTPTPALFGFQGTGTGNWSGQLVYKGNTYPVSGNMSVTIDANGVLSGSITSSTGNTADTTVTAQVDKNGNLTGTVSFVALSITFVTTWQGKVTASGNDLSLQGTWTSEYGSGIFSGTGTK